MRFKTGNYRIDYYDRYGGRLKGQEESAEGFTQSLSIGESKVGAGDIASFTVIRVLYNSLDDRGFYAES